MKRAVIVMMLLAVLVFALMPVASAHVHGVTPLTCGIGNADNSGGLRTDDTPAAFDNGGPIAGLIPRDTGNSPLGFGDGGFRPANNPHCS